MISRIPILLSILLLSSCGTLHKPYYGDDALDWMNTIKTDDKLLQHCLYLVGDAGDLDDEVAEKNYVLEAVKEQLIEMDIDETLVYLGDNLYPHGLVPRSHDSRAFGESILDCQLELARSVQGETVFIPGNHDWKKGKQGGLKYIRRQEQYIEDYFDRDSDPKVRMYPSKGCADPKVIKMGKDLVFVFLDTQWWLQDWDRETDINHGCEIKSKVDLLKSIEEIFTEYKNDEIVVLMHHPILSNGSHGGKFSLKQHLFPLTDLNSKLWIPLPILGSIYPMHRQITGSVQDIPHARNKELMQGLDRIARRLGVNVIFASGHEHSLQYYDDNDIKYIVSGSGSRTGYTMGGGALAFAREARGFGRILFYEDRETWLEFYTVDGFGEKARLEFRTMLRAAREGTIDDKIKYPVVEEKDTIASANGNFQAGKLKTLLLGDQYRQIWAAKVKLPIIDLRKTMGGLTPIKKGGGMASNSLRLEAKDEKQYILRSVNKDYTKLVPPQFSNLKILNVMKDQNSASHPYGALAVPTLSQAAGIYYTSPRLVYLKHQDALQNYNTLFPEEFYLLEQRPSGDWRDASQFGNSEDIIGYTDLLEILRTKKRHYVDQRWVCKSRMFDMLIHDWDRHDDQWRWASFKINKDSIVYRPIPRDRDQVFYKFRGVIPSLVAASVMKKFKGMKHRIKDVRHLAFNARYFDRYFMNELEWSDWQEVIEELQSSFDRDIFESAFEQMPDEIPDQDSREIASMLSSRNKSLLETGRKLYEYISKEVEVSATDDKNRFVITFGDDHVNVEYFVERDERGDLLKYSRNFYPDETREIRLYGLRGKDEFLVKGAGKSSIQIRIIGGEDKDRVTNETGHRIIVYDDPTGVEVSGSNIRTILSDEIENNEYVRNSFRYNTSLTLPTFGYTKDDGFWLGLSSSITKHGWRKNPYKSLRNIRLLVGPWSNEAFRVDYDAVFTDLFGTLDFRPVAKFYYPVYDNFFGFGNESVNPLREREFNWVRRRSIHIAPMVSLTSKNKQFRIDFGPFYERNKIINQEGRVADDPTLGFGAEDFEAMTFIGGKISNVIEVLDRVTKPTYGFKLHLGAGYFSQTSDDDKSFWSFKANSQSYLRIANRPELVLANSIGFERVDGVTQFYQMPSLGNFQNLRGYRHNRFRGQSAFFENVDLRIKLTSSNNDILPFDVGVLAGYDIGRVWLNNEDSDQWHQSFSVGLWFDILGVSVLQPYFSWTKEEDLFSLRFGYNF